MNEKATVEKSSVLDRLKKVNKENTGDREVVLGVSELKVTLPIQIMHKDMQRAQLKGRKDKKSDTSAYIIAEFCTFEGEKLTADQIVDNLPADDFDQLVSEIMGKRIARMTVQMTEVD